MMIKMRYDVVKIIHYTDGEKVFNVSSGVGGLFKEIVDLIQQATW